MAQLHYLVFDGNTYYPTDFDGTLDDDIEIIDKGYNLDALNDKAIELTEKAYP